MSKLMLVTLFLAVTTTCCSSRIRLPCHVLSKLMLVTLFLAVTTTG